MDILKFATWNAALLMKRNDHLGSIEVGFDADIVAVSQNPLNNIKTMLDVT